MKNKVLKTINIGLLVLGIGLFVINLVFIFVGLDIGKGLPIMVGSILLVVVSVKSLSFLKTTNKGDGVK